MHDITDIEDRNYHKFISMNSDHKICSICGVGTHHKSTKSLTSIYDVMLETFLSELSNRIKKSQEETLSPRSLTSALVTGTRGGGGRRRDAIAKAGIIKQFALFQG
jgi:hypothetical protein